MSTEPLILIDGQVARPPCTGVPWSVVELVRALSAEARGLGFALATDHPELFPFLDGAPGWRVVPCGAGSSNKARVSWTQLGLPRLAGELGADLLHVPTFPVPMIAPCPMVVTIHDVAFRLHPETVERARRWWYRVLLPLSLSRVRSILVNSETTGRELVGLYPRAAGKIEVTRFGTPQWVADREPPPLRGPGAPLLFVGALEPRKNLSRILAAFTRFRAEAAAAEGGRARPRLVVVGADGWCNHRIHNELQRMAGEGGIEIAGHCDREDLWQHLISARVLLFPSLHEGFGFPILEAMAARLPVITSNRGAMREVAGEAALLVEPESTGEITRAMIRLWRDDDLAGRLAAAGLARCRDFDWRTTAERTCDTYHRLLSRRSM